MSIADYNQLTHTSCTVVHWIYSIVSIHAWQFEKRQLSTRSVCSRQNPLSTRSTIEELPDRARKSDNPINSSIPLGDKTKEQTRRRRYSFFHLVGVVEVAVVGVAESPDTVKEASNSSSRRAMSSTAAFGTKCVSRAHCSHREEWAGLTYIS